MCNQSRHGDQRGSVVSTGTVVALVCGFAAMYAHAQTYPVKPVRLIIPFVAGGPGDTVGRMVTPKLSELWGQQIIVDNRGGANSIMGSEIAARAPADGHTLLVVSAGFAINVSLYPKLPYDPHRDFVPITPITFGPSMLVAHPSVPVRNLKELIALAKAKPGALTFASAGVGAPGSHLAVELIKVNAGIDLVHVPYKSMAPGMTDLLGGQVHLSSPTVVVALPHVRSGRVRAIGVTADKRLAVAPIFQRSRNKACPVTKPTTGTRSWRQVGCHPYSPAVSRPTPPKSLSFRRYVIAWRGLARKRGPCCLASSRLM